ncbi:MAG: beta-N-acetylhexosaminidase [Chitinophagaceae bacterium]
MKRLMTAAFFAAMIGQASAQQPVTALIPIPVSFEQSTGNFNVTASTTIELSSTDADARRVANMLAQRIALPTGFKIDVQTVTTPSNTDGNIRMALVKDATLGAEGYKLNVNNNAVSITANTAAGLFYGAQSFLQLLPKEIESKTAVKDVAWTVQSASITDYPRFGYRGLMLDVTRHFFTKEEVKDFIDNMVKYKYNKLHLHLTDDQGWRIEIKSLPKLTEVGAWRPKREGKWLNSPKPDPSERKDYGGFYTHDDIRELVKYAQERFVDIIPEIDVPGHSLAAIASYPNLSCTPGNYYVSVGDKIMQWHTGGGFSALIDNNLCPAKEEVYTFLDKVFTEVAELFPYPYIHMGGDEAAKNFWEKSAAVKALMQKEKLKDMHEVQSYFVKRVARIIESKGKKMMGWDEILEGGLPPNATVMSWRGMKGGIQAAKMGHQVIMSPSDFVYLDLMQGDPIVEHSVYSTVRLNKTYQFDPLPQGISKDMILGGQGNLWTEQLQNMRAVQYMVWPRGLAVAESVWSPKENKDWMHFVARMEKQMERMDVAKIKYARTAYEPILKVTQTSDKRIKVEMTKEIADVDIHYSFDETQPDEFYPKYTGALVVPKDAAHLKVVTYRNGKQAGRVISYPLAELEKRAGIKK